MRKNHQEQFTLCEPWLAHEHARELEAISDLLDANPTAATLAAQDLVLPGADPEKGRDGMTGDFAFRAAVVRQLNGFSYTELAFHLLDSATYRRFCRLGPLDQAPKRATLAANIKRLSASTWEAINGLLIKDAQARELLASCWGGLVMVGVGFQGRGGDVGDTHSGPPVVTAA